MRKVLACTIDGFAVFFTGIRAFFDRNWNLLFNREKYMEMRFHDDCFMYNDNIGIGASDLRCLGNGWYKAT